MLLHTIPLQTHTHTHKQNHLCLSKPIRRFNAFLLSRSLPLLLILSLQLPIPDDKQNPHAERNFTSNWKLVLLRAAYSKWAAQQVELVRPDSVAHSSATKLQNQPTHAHTLTYAVERASSNICSAPTLRWLAKWVSEKVNEKSVSARARVYAMLLAIQHNVAGQLECC